MHLHVDLAGQEPVTAVGKLHLDELQEASGLRASDRLVCETGEALVRVE